MAAVEVEWQFRAATGAELLPQQSSRGAASESVLWVIWVIVKPSGFAGLKLSFVLLTIIWTTTSLVGGDTGTTAESPACGGKTRAGPETMRPCNSRHLGVNWLPVVQRLEYKLCLLVHKAVIGQAPDYITNLLTPVTNIPSRSSLRASIQQRRPLPTKNRAANWWPCIFCHRTSCMESPVDRTETHAVVGSNIQAPSEVYLFHGVLTM